MTDISVTIADLLGVETVRLSHFASGDLSSLMRVETPDGRHFIAKGGPAPDVEGEMLRRIAATGAPAPAVIATSSEILVIEKVPGGSGIGRAGGDLGQVLGKLHGATGSTYGFDADYAFGKVAIRNAPSPSWVGFWRDNRLLNNVPHVASPVARRLEALAGRLGDLIPDTPPAALLHGDLWSGNVMHDGRRVTALIDPACYHGHGEVDLAMLHLFGNPGPDFYATYPPLDPGAQERRAVYSLWPALVHLRLFGEGYRGMVDGFLRQCGV
ncbi:fructosamine kinase family protein [Martelella endophytica]|uniref:Aminoglycoside phosphotransferase n=1 Tax=Martelella endophytica TaxID=1486262 RepID=A0A0D5LRN9_MAREN|nr:fructosamine kinase family protein [Martelella endophytica]AJY46417.1 aminoglycoside phosphotransferase [Martelella endophytica]